MAFSCSSEKPVNLTSKPRAETSGEVKAVRDANGPALPIEIIPAAATRNDNLTAMSKSVDLSQGRIVWMVNNIAGPEGFSLKGSTLKRGDIVQAKAILHDREIFSNKVQIRNAPPEITRLKLNSAISRPGDVFSVDASAMDPEGDQISFSYEWTKNGEPSGKTRELASPLKRGDKITVKVTPYDGQDYGTPFVLERKIDNMPPVFIDDKHYDFDGRLFSHTVRAVDADGDTLTYSLKSGPEGMTVNPRTGLVTWNVPLDFKGKAPFTVAVNDGKGAESTFVFDLDISAWTRQ